MLMDQDCKNRLEKATCSTILEVEEMDNDSNSMRTYCMLVYVRVYPLICSWMKGYNFILRMLVIVQSKS